jgi:hypothetical protein
MCLPSCADPTYRPQTVELPGKRYTSGAPFKFALPQPEFLNFSGPGGEPMKRGEQCYGPPNVVCMEPAYYGGAGQLCCFR